MNRCNERKYEFPEENQAGSSGEICGLGAVLLMPVVSSDNIIFRFQRLLFNIIQFILMQNMHHLMQV